MQVYGYLINFATKSISQIKLRNYVTIIEF